MERQSQVLLIIIAIVTSLILTKILIYDPATNNYSDLKSTNTTSTTETNTTTLPPTPAKISGVINVVAKQYLFTLNGSNNITLHKNLRYMVNITSLDVVHTFHISELNYTIDAIPDRFNSVFLQFTDISNEPAGGYLVICTEYCGPGHYTMSQDYPNGGAGRLIVV